MNSTYELFLFFLCNFVFLLNSLPGLAEEPLVLWAVAEDPDCPDDDLLRLGRGGPVEAPHQGARDALGVEQGGVLVILVGHVGHGPHAPGSSFNIVET